MAGPVSGLSGTMSLVASVQGQTVDLLLGNRPVGPLSIGKSAQFVNASPLAAGVILADQCKWFTTSIAASATGTIDLGAASANISGDATATFAKIKAILFQLPAITDIPSLGLTVQASSVTLGAGAANGAKLFFTSATTMTADLHPGDVLAFLKTASSITVDGTHKTVDVLNNDGVNGATLVTFVMGTNS